MKDLAVAYTVIVEVDDWIYGTVPIHFVVAFDPKHTFLLHVLNIFKGSPLLHMNNCNLITRQVRHLYNTNLP